MNWGRSLLLGAALAAAGTVAALAVTQLRPHAKSESRNGAANGVVAAPPGGVPLVKAEPGPLKVKPKDPGGLKIPHRDKSIYERLEGHRKVVPAGDAGKTAKKPAAKAAPKAMQKKLAQAIGPYRVQLGAFDSSESAQRRWQELRSRHADLVGRLTMVLERVDVKAKGTLYRLQAGPLNSPEDVQKLCAALAKRKVACFLVKS